MKRKIKVSWLTRKREGALKICEKNIIAFLEKDNRIDIKVHVIPYSENIFLQLLYLIYIFPFLWKIYLKSDIVQMYAVCNYFIILNPLLKKLSSKTTTIASFTHVESNNAINLMSRVITWSWHSFDNYITMSDYSKEQLLQVCPLVKSKTIYLGVNNKFRPKPEQSFLPFKYILYVGDEYKRKNIETFLEAFANLGEEFKNLMFVKIGKAAQKYDIEKIDNAITKLGLSDRVIIKRTFVSDDNLIRYYSNAELLVSPSSLEGFGLPVIEACKCKCIPLISSIKTYKEFNLPEHLYVNDYMSKHAWQDSLEKLLRISKEEKIFLKEKIEEIGSHFTWERNAIETAEYYIEILNK